MSGAMPLVAADVSPLHLVAPHSAVTTHRQEADPMSVQLETNQYGIRALACADDIKSPFCTNRFPARPQDPCPKAPSRQTRRLAVSPVGWISAPLLPHFCAMKSNSKLHRTTLSQVSSESQPIVQERVVSERDLGVEGGREFQFRSRLVTFSHLWYLN
jgi:hypothetical protein